MKNAPALHGRDHNPGGADPIPFLAETNFGIGTQPIYLPAFANVTNCDVSTSIGWVWDFTTWTGGYVSRTGGTPANGDYFSFMALLSPQGSIWQFSFTYWIGPSYGKLQTSIASLEYESSARPLGCNDGKIAPWDEGYDTINYLTPLAWLQDCYNASETQELVGGTGVFQVIPGGLIGDPLTDISDIGNPCADGGGLDPYTSVLVMDGGPGWYRFKMSVNGKNASSSGYKFRVSSATLLRLDDALAV